MALTSDKKVSLGPVTSSRKLVKARIIDAKHGGKGPHTPRIPSIKRTTMISKLIKHFKSAQQKIVAKWKKRKIIEPHKTDERYRHNNQ